MDGLNLKSLAFFKSNRKNELYADMRLEGIRNDIVDVTFLAYGTHFQEVLSADVVRNEIHDSARTLLKLLLAVRAAKTGVDAARSAPADGERRSDSYRISQNLMPSFKLLARILNKVSAKGSPKPHYARL